jgi:hypothetical protein
LKRLHRSTIVPELPLDCDWLRVNPRASAALRAHVRKSSQLSNRSPTAPSPSQVSLQSFHVFLCYFPLLTAW